MIHSKKLKEKKIKMKEYDKNIKIIQLIGEFYVQHAECLVITEDQ